MKKILIYFCIFFGLAAMVVSTNRELMAFISAQREYGAPKGAWWGAYKPDAGDLTGMSYLSKQKKFVEAKDYQYIKPADTGRKNVNLYVYGDSYVMEVPDTAFAGLNSYTFARRGQKDIEFDADSTKKQILIIEIGERFVRDYFSGLFILSSVREQKPKTAFNLNAYDVRKHVSYADAGAVNMGEVFISAIDLFNNKINQNLEFNLFNYPFINPMRMAKAELNYGWFNRASGDVTISRNGKYLFLKEITEKKGNPSNYEKVSDQQLYNIVNNLNTIYDSFTQRGIDEVYLSIIPNPPTFLQPEGYNQLIPKIQGHPALKVPIIDVYSAIKNGGNPETYYRMGDTHWNNKGLQTWIGMVNREVRKWNYPELAQ